MKRQHRKLSKRAKKRIAIAMFDTFMKITGIGMFFIGIAGLAEVPTDPRMIVRCLGLFIGGVCMVAWNSYLLSGKEQGKRNDRSQRY